MFTEKSVSRVVSKEEALRQILLPHALENEYAGVRFNIFADGNLLKQYLALICDEYPEFAELADKISKELFPDRARAH